MWNFYKILESYNEKTYNLKYLERLPDRFDYESLESKEDLTSIWESILEEYGELEKSSGISNDIKKRGRLINRWAMYLEEQALIKSLYIESDFEVLKKLESRGYRFDHIKSKEDYWKALEAASKRVHYHITFMEKIKLSLDKEHETPKNLYDTALALLSENNITFSEDITVKRYVILNSRINGSKRGTI